MGELYYTHAREEVRRGEPEGTKRLDDPGVEWKMDLGKCQFGRRHYECGPMAL
jgi:hypothetical protein